MTASLQKDPNQVQVHKKLGTIFYRMDNFKKAVHHWSTALQLEPNQPELLNELAFTKAALPEESFYDPNQAVQLAMRACELTGYETPQFLDTLAVAYASANRFPEAVQTAQKSLNLAIYLKNNELIAEIGDHVELFKTGRPFRQE